MPITAFGKLYIFVKKIYHTCDKTQNQPSNKLSHALYQKIIALLKTWARYAEIYLLSKWSILQISY